MIPGFFGQRTFASVRGAETCCYDVAAQSSVLIVNGNCWPYFSMIRVPNDRNVSPCVAIRNPRTSTQPARLAADVDERAPRCGQRNIHDMTFASEKCVVRLVVEFQPSSNGYRANASCTISRASELAGVCEQRTNSPAAAAAVAAAAIP